MQNPKVRLSKAFTLIEILIVISIIALVTGLTIPGFGNFVKRKNFEKAVNQLVADIQSAQSKSQSGSLITAGAGSLTTNQNTNGYWGINVTCGAGGTAGNYSIRYLSESAAGAFTVSSAGVNNNLENRTLNQNLSSRPYSFSTANGSAGTISICQSTSDSIYFDRFTGGGFTRSNQSAFSQAGVVEIVVNASDINESRTIRVYRNGKIEAL